MKDIVIFTIFAALIILSIQNESFGQHQTEEEREKSVKEAHKVYKRELPEKEVKIEEEEKEEEPEIKKIKSKLKKLLPKEEQLEEITLRPIWKFIDKYSSLDDKLDNLHFYTWFIKTGRGRATEDAALEVRNEIITRDEAVALVKKYDGEFPKKYFKEILEYLDMSEKQFIEVIDSFRPDFLWKKEKKTWELKQAVWMNN